MAALSYGCGSSCTSLASLVVGPIGLRSGNVALLPSFAAAHQQNDQSITVATEIKSIARPEVEPSFQNTATDALYVGEIAERELDKSLRHPRTRHRIQPIEPSPQRAATGRVEIVAEFDQAGMGNVSVTFRQRRFAWPSA